MFHVIDCAKLKGDIGSPAIHTVLGDVKRQHGSWGRQIGAATTQPRQQKTPDFRGAFAVGDTGTQPVTPSVSGKRATAAPIAQTLRRGAQFGGGYGIRTRVNGFAGRCLASRPIHRAGFTTTDWRPACACPRSERMTTLQLATPTLAR